MKKLITIAAVLMMVFTFGIAAIHAQQANTQNHGNMMMGNDCQMMTMADGTRCTMSADEKCLMAADRCPLTPHHESKPWVAPPHGGGF